MQRSKIKCSKGVGESEYLVPKLVPSEPTPETMLIEMVVNTCVKGVEARQIKRLRVKLSILFIGYANTGN